MTAKTQSDGERAKLHRSKTAPRRLWADRIARWLITAGGLAIVASILGILFFILVEVGPLLGGTDVTNEGAVVTTPEEVGGVLVDEYRSHAVVLDLAGGVRAFAFDDGREVLSRSLFEVSDAGAEEASEFELSPTRTSNQPADLDEGAELEDSTSSLPAPSRFVAALAVPGDSTLIGATDRGSVLAVPVEFRVNFDGDETLNAGRQIVPWVGEPIRFQLDGQGEAVSVFAARVADDGSAAAVAQLNDRRLVLVQRSVEENLFSGEITESQQRVELEAVPYRLTAIALGAGGRDVYAGAEGGEILWWQLVGGSLGEPQILSAGPSVVSSIQLLIGDRSLIVGQANGDVSQWFPVRDDEQVMRMTRIREFEPLSGPIQALAASPRNKAFVASDGDEVSLFYATTGKRLWRGELPAELGGVIKTASFSPKADGLFLGGGSRVVGLVVDNPHPEVSLKGLFGKLWYEGYEEPEYVWQSSSATDDFEPKLSLTPLMVGTLKGTFYSLLLAIPLGVLGAMYLSHFMSPRFKAWIKPAVEIMASLPSVVLGFLAGLWLAPRLEQVMPGLFLGLMLIPACILLTGWAWSRLPRRFRNRFPSGSEVMLFSVAILAGGWLAVVFGPAFESIAFGGNFQAWLLETTGLPFDQRNAVVVGLAMGFAVIPIIFAISEDAFSNVPPNLVSGSLALGANRWQTVTKVVLPTASPGIFSAIMIGFGRAVGETMIVLMATGNTPIMDWNPFNGFRTLSANIAVEIPEAPQAGTLYRTLFLAALVLFVLTFLINTVAELVRQRLRNRYSRL